MGRVFSQVRKRRIVEERRCLFVKEGMNRATSCDCDVILVLECSFKRHIGEIGHV